MKRIYAGVVDFVITCVIQMVLMVIFILKPLLNNDVASISFNVLTRQLVITCCSTLYLVVKDIIGKKSIGKRIFKLKIVSKNTNAESPIIKRFLRNTTWLLGPIDILVYLINKERLGDKIAGTRVVES
jgi:uncharacterized RDD family membrane protein YckC